MGQLVPEGTSSPSRAAWLVRVCKACHDESTSLDAALDVAKAPAISVAEPPPEEPACVGAYHCLMGKRPSDGHPLAPWQKGRDCRLCEASFGLLTWRHHCRLCGSSACTRCAPRRHAASGGTLRICHDCSGALAAWQAGRAIAAAQGHGALSSSSSGGSLASSAASETGADRDDTAAEAAAVEVAACDPPPPSSADGDFFRTLDGRVDDLFASMSGVGAKALLELVGGADDEEAVAARRAKRAQRRRSMRTRSVQLNSMQLKERVASSAYSPARALAEELFTKEKLSGVRPGRVWRLGTFR